ncbi:MAG: peptide deformylase [Clostridiales bacterium]|nr:peptide deformylase [Clostridiales bacterium]
MAIRKIVEIGDDKLRKVCKPVEKFDKRLKALLDDMADTMYKAEGVGLAGPQVGILRRVAVIDVGEGLFKLVNPVIVETEGEQTGLEGCLSVPGRRGEVTRPNIVTVQYQDENGEPVTLRTSEFFARAVCHELDHLDGVLYIDKMNREISDEEYEEMMEEDEEYDEEDDQ